jgi:hypothetical protein
MKTFTINSAAELLERDRRTVARALRGVPAEHKDAQGHERWRLPVIIDALSANRGEGASAAVIDEILAAAEAVEKLLQQLRAAAEDGVEQARAVLRAEGHHIGALDAALQRGLVGLRPAESQLLGVVRDDVVRAATAEALGFCNWRVAGA